MKEGFQAAALWRHLAFETSTLPLLCVSFNHFILNYEYEKRLFAIFTYMDCLASWTGQLHCQ